MGTIAHYRSTIILLNSITSHHQAVNEQDEWPHFTMFFFWINQPRDIDHWPNWPPVVIVNHCWTLAPGASADAERRRTDWHPAGAHHQTAGGRPGRLTVSGAIVGTVGWSWCHQYHDSHWGIWFRYGRIDDLKLSGSGNYDGYGGRWPGIDGSATIHYHGSSPPMGFQQPLFSWQNPRGCIYFFKPKILMTNLWLEAYGDHRFLDPPGPLQNSGQGTLLEVLKARNFGRGNGAADWRIRTAKCECEITVAVWSQYSCAQPLLSWVVTLTCDTLWKYVLHGNVV